MTLLGGWTGGGAGVRDKGAGSGGRGRGVGVEGRGAGVEETGSGDRRGGNQGERGREVFCKSLKKVGMYSILMGTCPKETISSVL